MSILAKHTKGKGGPDKIFRISGMAKARAAEVGKENITNATTGAFLDGNGHLITLKTVEETVKEIPFSEAAEYATIEGSPGSLCIKHHKGIKIASRFSANTFICSPIPVHRNGCIALI